MTTVTSVSSSGRSSRRDLACASGPLSWPNPSSQSSPYVCDRGRSSLRRRCASTSKKTEVISAWAPSSARFRVGRIDSKPRRAYSSTHQMVGWRNVALPLATDRHLAWRYVAIEQSLVGSPLFPCRYADCTTGANQRSQLLGKRDSPTGSATTTCVGRPSRSFLVPGTCTEQRGEDHGARQGDSRFGAAIDERCSAASPGE